MTAWLQDQARFAHVEQERDEWQRLANGQSKRIKQLVDDLDDANACISNLNRRIVKVEKDRDAFKEGWKSRGRRMNGVGEFADLGPMYHNSEVAEFRKLANESLSALARSQDQLEVFADNLAVVIDERDLLRDVILKSKEVYKIGLPVQDILFTLWTLVEDD